MLTRDDEIVLEDWLIKYNKWFNKIFVLNSSIKYVNICKEILIKYNIDYNHDNDFPNINKRDHGLRKVLFDKIKLYIENDRKKTNSKFDYWIVLVHPDEFYQEHFSISIKKAYNYNKILIQMNNCHNFPHISEIENWKKHKSYKVFKHFLYPGHCENRIFKYKDGLYYDETTHSLVLPHGIQKIRKNILSYRSNISHYKIQTVDPDFYSENGRLNKSCWSTLSLHYPDGHTSLKR